MADGTATPNGVSSTSVLGSPSESGGAAAAPAGVHAVSAKNAATESGTATAAPSGGSATSWLGVLNGSGGGIASPSGVAVSSSAGSCSLAASAVAAPAAVVATCSVGAASEQAAALASPSGVTVLAALGKFGIVGFESFLISDTIKHMPDTGILDIISDSAYALEIRQGAANFLLWRAAVLYTAWKNFFLDRTGTPPNDPITAAIANRSSEDPVFARLIQNATPIPIE